MFLTVTPNSALDRVIFIDQFAPETVMRTTRWVDSVGGKGFDTSVALRALGAETLAVGFMAGPTGEQLQRLLERYGIMHDLVWVEGETRTAHIIAETALGRISHIMIGALTVSAPQVDDLLRRIDAHLPGARWLIGGGSLPSGLSPDLFAQTVARAHAHGVPSLLDISGPPALAAAPAKPTILKMNRREFCATFDLDDIPWEALLSPAKDVAARLGLGNLVLTGGADGILAITEQGGFHAAAPHQRVVNAAGAGDAASAALAWRLAEGDNWPSALRWAAATGAAVVLTEGTADCDMADIQRILPAVHLTALSS